MLADRFKVSELSRPCLTDWIAIDAEKRCGQVFPPMSTSMGSHSRIRVNFDENETGNDLFYVTLPTEPGRNLKEECEMNTKVIDPVYQTTPDVQLCTYITTGNTNVCQCKFSNFPDNTAQAFKIKVPSVQVSTLCPKIKGYTAHPERIGNPNPSNDECSYYANIRITDVNNTGFCLRYQAM